MITRRSLFRGLGASIALVAAPSIVRAASLMPVKAQAPMAWLDAPRPRYAGFVLYPVNQDAMVQLLAWQRGLKPNTILQGRVVT